MSLPTLNLSDFARGSPVHRSVFADDLLDSLMKHGFVKLEGHGVTEEMVEKLFNMVCTNLSN